MRGGGEGKAQNKVCTSMRKEGRWGHFTYKTHQDFVMAFEAPTNLFLRVFFF